ncbi:MAG: hypothetical protein IT318_07650 [Anaerolineales bacterium]|nr:hypothetical protein [Anaerolineales bacterium]
MNRHSKSIIAIALSLVLLLNAYAAIAYTETIYFNYIPSPTYDHAIASEDVVITGPTTWTAVTRSFMIDYSGALPGSGRSINVIGYNWWTFREWCNGVIWYQYPQSGAVNYNSSLFANYGYASSHAGCGSGHNAESVANHEFNNTGGPHWQPTWSQLTPI